MGNFYLIGVDYRDVTRGPSKLERLYARIKPDMVLSDSNRTNFEAMRGAFSAVKSELLQLTENRVGIERLVDSFSVYFGFPVLTNREYAQSHNIPHHFVGVREPMPTREFVAFEDHIIFVMDYVANHGVTPKLIQTLDGLRGNPPKSEEIQHYWDSYMQMERSMRNELILLIRDGRKLRRHTKYNEARVRELYDPSKVIAFPIGISQATDSLTKSTLYSRIKDLKPERLPLI